ncbi:hypothetical protein K7432_017390 [Basidiobolus ranarum]|uniref:Uncharacterized protein n=1 Tax=Basidiobolus ranarum TaxID=34480 RepID=A0ABR2WDG6_9FUNG
MNSGAATGTAFGGNQQAPSGNAFGNTPSAFGANNTVSAFGNSSGSFGATANQAPAFGQTGFGNPQVATAFGQTAFGQQQTPANANPFGGNSGGAFNQNNTATPSVFGANTTAQQPTGFFASVNTSQPATSFFGSQAAQTNGFSQTGNLNIGNVGAPTTTMATLQPNELEAFQAPQFQYQHVPEVEPPVELRAAR